jgi:hypothetical protein
VQRTIDAKSGQRQTDQISESLDAAARGAVPGPDDYHEHRREVQGDVVRAWVKHDEPAGYVGGGQRLLGPGNVLKHLFGTDR